MSTSTLHNNAMFFKGDIQSGIATAVQDSKIVVCFVADDSEESVLWETEFFSDSHIKSSLSARAVLLRLEAGSQEVAFLAAIYPLPKTPTVVVIKNGELKEYLTAGVTKADFSSRLHRALDLSASTAAGPPTSTVGDTRLPLDASSAIAPRASTTNENGPGAPSSSATAQQSQTVQDLLNERAIRLAAQKEDQDAREKAQRAADARKRKETLEAESPPGSHVSAEWKYALLQKKRQQDARDEKSRILKRVEDDKAARRERDNERRAQAKAKESSYPTQETSSINNNTSNQTGSCALQIRLFDGSTIRSSFPSSATIRADVKPWIDTYQPGDSPYNLKQILIPFANRTIEASDEESSLSSLGLTPNATLILQPVSGYTSAYDTIGSTGLLSRGISGVFSLFSSGIGGVSNLFGTTFGGSAPLPSANQPPAQAAAHPEIRNTPEKEQPDEQQFYNGNSLTFMPRKKSDEEKDL